jgi:serine/threonine protein phosphatase PrpC
METSADPWRRPQKGGHAMTITVPEPVPTTRVVSGSGIASGVAVTWGAVSRRGAARADNQDNYLALPPVFAVADGMGGHAAGDVASRCVVDALCALAEPNEVTAATFGACLAEARAAIARIHFDSGAPPGSTLSGAIVTRDRDGRACWMVVNIGDSRTYRWDGRRLAQLTVDHTVAQELVQYGALPASATRSTPFGHLLTRAVMADIEHQPDIGLFPLAARDRILVCSDGLTGQLDEATIAHVLRSAADPPQAATELVDRVTEAAGQDDATALVVDACALRA